MAFWYDSYGYISVVRFFKKVYADYSSMAVILPPTKSCLLTSFCILLAVGFMKLPFGLTEAGVPTLLDGSLFIIISVYGLYGEYLSLPKAIIGLSN